MIHLQSLLTEEAKVLVDGYGCNGDLYAAAFQDCKNILTIQRGLSKLFLTNCQTLETQTYQILKIIHSTPHFF